MLHCECGFEARAEDEGEFVAQVQRHAAEAHGMALSYEEALLLAFHAELGPTRRSIVQRRELRDDTSGRST